jgi:hypothetical protein
MYGARADKTLIAMRGALEIDTMPSWAAEHCWHLGSAEEDNITTTLVS